MELQQLRYVVAVAREKNFTRAAGSCFVVQSALSHQVKALENELGVALFSRTSRRVELTAAGEAFLPSAQTCLDAADRAAAQAVAATGKVRGPLRVGTIPTVTALDIPDLLASFRDVHPDVAISLDVGGSDGLQSDLEAGRLDIALLGLPADETPRVAHRLLDRHRLVAVLPSGHPLTERKQLTLADLADQPFADFPAGTPGRAQSDNAFDRAGIAREVTIQAMSVPLMLDLVARGLAVTLLAPGVVPESPAVIMRPVVDGPERAEYLAWNGFNPTPVALALLELVS